MPVVLRHNATLDLNVVEYSGAVSLAELKGLAEFQAGHPQHLRRDTLSHVCAGAHFSSVDLQALDALFAHYRKLFAPLNLQMVRRSAWLCESPAAQGHVRQWLGGDARTGMSSAVRQFDSVAQTGEWLLLTEAETDALARREGFVEIACFDEPTLASVR